MLGRNEVADAVDVAQWRTWARDEEEMLACLAVLIIKTNVRRGGTVHKSVNWMRFVRFVLLERGHELIQCRPKVIGLWEGTLRWVLVLDGR